MSLRRHRCCCCCWWDWWAAAGDARRAASLLALHITAAAVGLPGYVHRLSSPAATAAAIALGSSSRSSSWDCLQLWTVLLLLLFKLIMLLLYELS
jgi:hypothetical protein